MTRQIERRLARLESQKPDTTDRPTKIYLVGVNHDGTKTEPVLIADLSKQANQ